MNNDRLTSIFGLLAGIAEITARSGVLGGRTIIADGVASVALALLGFFAQRRSPAEPLE